MDTAWLDRTQLAAWARLATLVDVLPAVLDGQLRRDSDITLFEYFVLAMLSESPQHSLRMSQLAAQTNSTPARLSNVVRRLEDRSLVQRRPDPDDGRATLAVLAPAGLERVRTAAPGHVCAVRRHIIDVLTPEQLEQLTQISDVLLRSLDTTGSVAPLARRYDE